MSVLAPITRANPRASVGSGSVVLLSPSRSCVSCGSAAVEPASISGLSASGARVCTGPPLSASANNPGSPPPLMDELLVVMVAAAPMKLLVAVAIVPKTSLAVLAGPNVFSATTLLVRLIVATTPKSEVSPMPPLLVTGFGEVLWTVAIYPISAATLALFLARFRLLAEHIKYENFVGEDYARSHKWSLIDATILYDAHFNYHLEHHIFPHMPSCSLAKVHQLYRDEI